MLKKTIRRLGALAMVLAMAVSVFAVNASAAAVGNTELTIKKNVTTDGDTYAPATSFTFSVAPCTHTEATEGKFETNVVYPGVAGGAYFAQGNGTITFAPDTSDATKDVYEGTTIISTNAGVFTRPGIYHYTVTETKGSYEGISYDTAARDLYVYVVNDGNGKLKVSNVVLAKKVIENNEEKTVKSEEWTNDYGKDNDTIHSVKLTKKVTGTQGDLNKKFNFTVKVKGAVNEAYKVTYKASADEAAVTTYVYSDGSTVAAAKDNMVKTIAIANDGWIQIDGLSVGDKYTIKEVDYSSDGYTTKDNTVENLTTNVDKLGDNAYVVENNKTPGSPTGVIMTIAPYALMVVLAGAFAVVFLTRRNRAE